MTYAQGERQATRNNGRYSEMAKCESCDAAVGARYYSAASANDTGRGLILCKKCCTAWDKADTARVQK